jgi:hypothetical protein
MTNSQKADQLQIKPLDENTRPTTDNNQSADPRVAAFLERLRTKAQAIDEAKQEDHVTAKEPRRRGISRHHKRRKLPHLSRSSSVLLLRPETRLNPNKVVRLITPY